MEIEQAKIDALIEQLGKAQEDLQEAEDGVENCKRKLADLETMLGELDD